MKRSALLSLLVFAAVWAAPPQVTAAEDITAMLANAKTAADHQAIATYYDQQAAAAKENAALHKRMLDIVKKQGTAPLAKWHMDTHCESLIQKYESAAKDYTEMANAHREMAKDVK
jgi:hypothetical protein